jgi:hypothetical protein
LVTLALLFLDCVATAARTKLVGDPGSQNSGPGNEVDIWSSADSGIAACKGRIWMPVVCLEERAMSNPVFNVFEPWKQSTNFPPKPKLTTGARLDVLPKGSLLPNNDGDGAYGAWI